MCAMTMNRLQDWRKRGVNVTSTLNGLLDWRKRGVNILQLTLHASRITIHVSLINIFTYSIASGGKIMYTLVRYRS